jgi:chromate transporter
VPLSGVDDRSGRLGELARVFLKLGSVSFGGPAAHIALMRHELVERRQWLGDREFLDLVGATNLIPGPNSTEMAIHIGLRRAGWPGLVVAGCSFILPAVVIVGLLAALYVRVGTLPETQAIFYGVKPVVVAIVTVALWRLARAAIGSWWHAALAVAAMIASLMNVHELTLLAICGFLGGLASMRGTQRTGSLGAVALAVPSVVPAGTAAATVTSGTLALVFLKAGAFLFGSGYVLLAFLRADLVERLGWLTERQLLDAVSVGQFTPGPVFTTATFIGYLLDGWRGAGVATIAIFLPAFAFVALSGPLLPRIRKSPVAGGVLDGVNVGSLALMAAVTWQLGRVAVVDLPTVVLAVLSVIALLRLRINPAWLIAAGAAAGLLVR